MRVDDNGYNSKQEIEAKEDKQLHQRDVSKFPDEWDVQ